MYEMVAVVSIFINDQKIPIVDYTNDYLFRSETGCYISLVVDQHSIMNALIENEDIPLEVIEQIYFEGYCNEVE